MDVTYPLSASREKVHSATGRPVSDVTLERVVSGEIGSDDVRVSPEVLRLQAGFAQQGGNPQLAENLRRGAELIAFSDDELLTFYDKLRPGRATPQELESLAGELESRGASQCAALVREAAAAYVRRGLI